MQSELGRKIGHRPSAQDAGMPRAPGPVRFQILSLAAIGVVDAAVQDHFSRAPFDSRKWNFVQKRDGILIELPPARRVQFTE